MVNLKKVFLVVVMVAFVFVGIQDVSAEILWSDITERWVELLQSDEDYDVEATDESLTISYTTYVYDYDYDYSITYTYEDGVVDMVIRDNDELSDYERAIYATIDYFMNEYFIYYVLGEICDADLTSLSSDDYEEYGITYEATPLSYEEGTASITTEEVDEFSIDLEVFEEAVEPLKGTYSGGITSDSSTVTEPTAEITLSDATSSSLELAIVVSDLSSTESAYCEVYSIPSEDTTGESYLLGTIDNCTNGTNLFTVSNLEEATSYTFSVVLQSTTTTYASKYYTFSTLSADVTNPETGSNIIGIICFAIVSVAAIILSLAYMKKKAAI